MAKDSNQLQPIIIKRIKATAHAHHGGAWKVAYADFVTAMMAFFLLLWLLNATTEEQRRGIADYFAPTVITGGRTGSGMFGGENVTAKENLPRSGGISVPMPATTAAPEEAAEPDEETIARKIAEREQEQFEQAATELKQAIESQPELLELKENLIVDQTPEGLRIQIVDRERMAMFESGSAKPLAHTQRLLGMVAEVVKKLPNRISVSGHTDASPYRGGVGGYSNWELSADRANASRRLLTENGLDAKRIALVQGKAEIEPLIADDPASPRNRRISIVLLHDKPLAGAAAAAGTAAPAKSKAAPAGSLRPPTGVLGEGGPAPTPAR